MEGFELQGLLIDVSTTFLQRQRIVELRIKGQHVQLHLLTIYHLYGIHHVLDELGIRGSRWVDTHHHLRLLGLLLVGTLRAHLLTIGINSVFANLISSHDGRCQ